MSASMNGATPGPADRSTAVVLLNWNGWEDTIECLRSLRRVTHHDFQVIVVDNGSTNDSVARIASWARTGSADAPGDRPDGWKPMRVERAAPGPGAVEALKRLRTVASADRLLVIEAGENLGFSAGCNVGLRAAVGAGYRYINLLNNDTIVEPDYLARLIAALDDHPEWVAVGPKILCHPDRERIWYAGSHLRLRRANATHDGFGETDGPQWSGRRTTEHVSGCCLLTRAEVLRRFGLLDEDYFFGHEDWAYSTRLQQEEQQVGVDLDARIYHKSGASWGTGHPIYSYYFNKNRLLILKKEARGLDAFLGFTFYFLTRPLKVLPALLHGRRAEMIAEWRAIRDFMMGRRGEYDRQREARRRASAAARPRR